MRINALEDQETGFNGDIDDNDEVAAYSFIFVRENYTAFNEETQKNLLEVLFMKRNNLVYVWVRNGAWIDRNWNRLQNLCVDEAIDAGIEKPWVKATLMTVGSDEVNFQIKSNSPYVFQYMLTESIKKDIKKR